MVGKYIPQDISNLLEVVSKNLVPFPSYTEKKEVVGSCSNGLRGGKIIYLQLQWYSLLAGLILPLDSKLYH